MIFYISKYNLLNDTDLQINCAPIDEGEGLMKIEGENKSIAQIRILGS